ncbi:MAG TPA: histidine kinase dimerization/phospho-acceptor domain-containing protein, partial [Chitinophagaceae bacterium]|nr:histidine kinase dimerization/phospho-acceptor domain-containing protein [Chitinophagaceae bacterium]
MAVTVKNKIQLGTIFFFVLLILLGGPSIFFLVRLKNDANKIIKNNYETLTYCHGMQQQLDSFSIVPVHAMQQFDFYLKQQEENITESGEDSATVSLRREFDQWKAGDTTQLLKKIISSQIQSILSLNMKAIKTKNQRTEKRAEDTLTYISILATVIFIISITFLFNFPSIVTGPISELNEAIQQISRKNYSHRIHIKNKDEFGQMANAFNTMAERLEDFENSNLNKLMFEKHRAEAVINSLKDASIGIDRNNIILFANNQALQLLGLLATDIVGRSTDEVSKKNDLFRFLLTDKSNIPFKIVLDGKENYFTKEMVEIPQDDSKNSVIVVKNVTSFKELDVAKTNFIATVSHELKTPLASSDFSLKLLEDERTGKLSGEQKELIGQLKEDNQRMLRILSELLNMSQVEAGKIQLEIRKVEPLEIAETAILAVGNAAKEKNIRVEKQFNTSLPQINADAEKTGWVLNNFLTNAIKFSSEDN